MLNSTNTVLRGHDESVHLSPVSVPHDVILQVEAGDVADAAVADSTLQSNSGDDVCDADCLGLSGSVCGADEPIAEQHSDASR